MLVAARHEEAAAVGALRPAVATEALVHLIPPRVLVRVGVWVGARVGVRARIRVRVRARARGQGQG